MVREKDPKTPFIWTQGQIDEMNKWCADTSATLHNMLTQLHIFHNQLFANNTHDSSPQCPICKDIVLRKEKEEAEIIRKQQDNISSKNDERGDSGRSSRRSKATV
jgi:hypothetical protein